MIEQVLDAAAVLAYLRQEPGWEEIEQALSTTSCIMSAVNYAEVIGKLAEKGISESAIRAAMSALDLSVIEFDVEQAFSAGLLRPETKKFGLSLGDRACLALARTRQTSTVTTDNIWAKLKLDIDVIVVR